MQFDLKLTSNSADPVATYLKWLRQQAYGDERNPIQEALAGLDPDVASEAYLLVLGLPSVNSKDPIGFAIQDPFDDSFPVLYLKPQYNPTGKARVVSMKHMTLTLSGTPTRAVQQLLRINFDAL